MFVSFNPDVIRFNYFKPTIFRYSRQWALLNCTCNHNKTLCDQRANISLWFRLPKSVTFDELPVGNEKIELVTRNVFNITHLAFNDTGEYKCINKFWSSNTTITEEMTIYPLEILLLREGKIYKFKLRL